MIIRVDDLTGLEIKELLREHVRDAHSHSPAESAHALGIEELRGPEITLWTAWEEDALLGCGALKELDARHGEVKSMRTASEHLRKGIAKRLLNHIIAEAESRGYGRLSLETGSMEAFAPARRLYTRLGFTPCEPFADYIEDPYSVFMTRELRPPR